MNRISCILATLTVLCICCIAPCRAQLATDTCPDFSKYFDRLKRNNLEYNKYNDSIFTINDHNKWITLFLRRAIRHGQIYNENKMILSTVKDYFRTDKHPVPDSAYSKLFKAFHNFSKHVPRVDDPFLTLEICDIIEPYYATKSMPDSVNHLLRIKSYKALAYWNIYHLVRDTTYAEKAYECYQSAIDERNCNMAEYTTLHYMALSNLMPSTWINMGIVSYDEHMSFRRQLQKLVKDSTVIKALPKSNIQITKQVLRNDDMALAYNLGMKSNSDVPKQFTDSLMRIIVQRNDTVKNLKVPQCYRNLAFKNHLKQISINEALDQSMVYYKQTLKRLGDHLSDNELKNYIDGYFVICYFNDLADIPEKQKRKNVKKFCNDIVDAYRKRKEQQYSTTYIYNLERLVTYNRITKYLTPEERIEFLNNMYVATQVTTYAHSKHVAELCKVVMKGVLDYRPDLLAGTLGHNTSAEVKQHRNEYLDFIYDAAMYHDLGKNSMVSVIINEYRPTTDLEFSIIKTHPERGLKYLSLAPGLAKFHDTTLGHHKWYNGNGGYPKSYDNTKSDIKIMIDIVMICDCMQAATEKMGRNYKRDKNFDTLLKELIHDAGVRYNPDIVRIIKTKRDVSQSLNTLVSDGWVEIYYDIFSQFFR